MENSKTFIDYASNNNGSKKGGTMLSSLSILNNLLSAKNATDELISDGQLSETERSVYLAISDVVGVVGEFINKSKLGKSLQQE